MDILFYLYEMLLILYTSWRSFDFVSNQLPRGGDGVLNIMLSLAFLGATEFGLILWHFMSRKHANTNTQETTARVMTWVDFIASFGAGVADMILHQTLLEGYVMPPILAYLLLYGLPIIVAANVASGIIYKNNDANEMLERKQKQAEFEKVDTQLEILDATIKSLRDQKTAIANTVKKDAASVLRGEVMANIAGQFGLDGQKYGAVEFPEPEKKPAGLKERVSRNIPWIGRDSNGVKPRAESQPEIDNDKTEEINPTNR